MERLTVKRSDGRWALANNDGAKPLEQMEKIPIALNRLAAYEDTGLEPDEIITLKSIKSYADALEHELEKYMQAEKDGRLVVLPCKVGDFVWVNDDCVRDWSVKPLPYKCWVYGIEITGKGKRFHVECYRTGRVFPFDFDKFGKIVFLTREEAEAALKRREEDNEAD